MPQHKYHIRSDTPPSSVPTQLLADDAQETLEHLAAACCTTGVEQSYLMSKLGRYMSNSKIAYMYSSSDHAEPGLSKYDHLTKYFKQAKHIAYTVLWDAYLALPILSEGSFLSAGGIVAADKDDSTSCGRGNNLLTTTTELPYSTPPAAGRPSTSVTSCLLSHTKFDNMHLYIEDHSKDDSLIGLRQEGQMFRRDLQLPDDTKVFLAIAWVFKPELRYFKLFPEVIHVDGKSHST
jgi:hypothetical protein